jgi:formate-dependent phosphoribosylglycinamide formyltransferase (GAR transformylase)
MNSIVNVGDGDGLYGEQWNLSGDRRVFIVLSDLSPRPHAVLFNRLIPSVFHKTQNIHPKTPLKCDIEQGQIRSFSGLQTSKIN